MNFAFDYCWALFRIITMAQLQTALPVQAARRLDKLQAIEQVRVFPLAERERSTLSQAEMNFDLYAL